MTAALEPLATALVLAACLLVLAFTVVRVLLARAVLPCGCRVADGCTQRHDPPAVRAPW